MKKLMTALFIVAIALLFTIPALASDMNTYKIDEMGMSVGIPSELYAFTRDIEANDPNLETLGIDRQTALDQLSTDGYLVVFTKDMDHEIIVAQSDYDEKQNTTNLNDFSDSELKQMGEYFVSTFEEDGTTCEYELYKNSETVFIKLILKESGVTDSIHFYTIVNGKWVSILLLSSVNNVSSTMDAYLTEIVDSAAFDSLKTSPTISKTPTEYYSSDSGVKFTVPAGWGQYEPVEEQGYTKVKFVDSEGNTILFGFRDLWSEYPEDDKPLYYRSLFNNLYYYDDDLEKTINESDSTISYTDNRTLNNIEYYKLILDKDTFIGSEDTEMYAIIYDGFICFFDFSGDVMNSTAYVDFISLVSSAKYDKLPQSNILKTLLGIPANHIGVQMVYTYFLITLFAILPYMVPIVIYRYIVKKAPVPETKAKKITIIYGICFISILILLAVFESQLRIMPVSAILVSFANYAMLKGGKAKKAPINNYAMASGAPPYQPYSQQTYPQQPYPQQPYPAPNYNQPMNSYGSDGSPLQNTKFCTHCGAPLAPDSTFCPHCGNKVN